MSRRNCLRGAWVVLWLAAAVLPVWAQEEKPEKPAAKPKRERPAAAKPAASKPSAPREKSAEKTGKPGKPGSKEIEVPAIPPPPDPVVEAVLESNPATPLEQLRAAQTLSNLHRDDLGKSMLKKVLEAQLDDEHLYTLGEEFGGVALMNLSDRKGLLPEARKLLDVVAAARRRQAGDAKRIDGLVTQLRDPSADVRSQAMLQLLQTGGSGVVPLLAILADHQRAADHAIVREVLAGLKGDAAGPLLATLHAPDEELAAQAAEVVGRLGIPEVAPYLLAPALAADSPPRLRQAALAALRRTALPSDRSAAARLLATRAHDYFDRQQPVADTVEGRTSLWEWDATRKAPVSAAFAADTASCVVAARLAGDAYRLFPESADVRSIYFLAALETTARTGGFDKTLDTAAPAVAEAARLDVGELQQLLHAALQAGRPAAATLIMQVLGRHGGALLSGGGRPLPLVLATLDSDRRLRMAALEAVLKNRPTRPYAGSSYVADALTFFAASAGTRRVLLGGLHPNNVVSSIGALNAAGFEVDMAPNGREVLRLAMASPDYELILLDPAIDLPPAGLLLQQLRRDGRTATLPVGLVAREGQFEQAQAIVAAAAATGDSRCAVLVRPHDSAALKLELDHLQALAGDRNVGLEVRRQQAAQALEWLARISGGPEAALYDLRQVEAVALRALRVPEMVPPAVAVLAHLGTHESQTALVDAASIAGKPLEARKAAAAAFAENVHRFGVLLTSPEVRRQYDRYNQSQFQDRPTQQVLGIVLDVLEGPAAAAAQQAGGSSSRPAAANPQPPASKN